MKVFIDTNIFIDFIAARQPFAKEAAIIFQLADNKEIDLLLSDLTIINTIYILQRLHYPIDEIIDTIEELRPLLTITSVGVSVIDRCLQRRGNDFEDEVQYFSAIDAGADFIVTRNKKDYDFGDDSVITPSEFHIRMNITAKK